MLKKFILVLTATLSLFLTYVAFQSPDYFVVREVTIDANAEAIFPHINNSQKHEFWAPWKEVDPSIQMIYSGPDAGVGSKASWDSSGKMGTGSATVIESIANKSVLTALEYTKPFEMKQTAEMVIEPASNNNQSIVKWSVKGEQNFMGRLMCHFMNMDKMVGGMFERGLAKLKNVVESEQLNLKQ